MSHVEHCKKHGQHHGEICGECFEELKELEKAYEEQEEELDATMMVYNILKKENARLREALEILAAENSGTCCECWDVKDIARAALEQK